MVRLKPEQTFESAAAALHGVQPQIKAATIPPTYRPPDVERYLKDPIQLRSAATGQSFLRARDERPLLRRVAVLVAAGVVVGAVVSWWAARFVATLLYGLEPRDAATFAVGILVLLAVGALAGLVPARRAAESIPCRCCARRDRLRRRSRISALASRPPKDGIRGRCCRSAARLSREGPEACTDLPRRRDLQRCGNGHIC
jgi:hypothetical protein